MEEFLNKYCYIVIDSRGKYFYYTCAYVTKTSETHIFFIDKNENDEPHLFRLIEVVEIKLSNKNPEEFENENKIQKR